MLAAHPRARAGATLEPRRSRRYLALAYAPEPDLFIRTGGEQRISNFLLWQLAYTELYFTDTLWPDFDAAALDAAIASYRSASGASAAPASNCRPQPTEARHLMLMTRGHHRASCCWQSLLRRAVRLPPFALRRSIAGRALVSRRRASGSSCAGSASRRRLPFVGASLLGARLLFVPRCCWSRRGWPAPSSRVACGAWRSLVLAARRAAVGLPPLAAARRRLLVALADGSCSSAASSRSSQLQARSPWLVLAAMALVWIADTAAYFAGTAFGRRKLAPPISPGKTWEGVYGALAARRRLCGSCWCRSPRAAGSARHASRCAAVVLGRCSR